MVQVWLPLLISRKLSLKSIHYESVPRSNHCCLPRHNGRRHQDAHRQQWRYRQSLTAESLNLSNFTSPKGPQPPTSVQITLTFDVGFIQTLLLSISKSQRNGMKRSTYALDALQATHFLIVAGRFGDVHFGETHGVKELHKFHGAHQWNR